MSDPTITPAKRPESGSLPPTAPGRRRMQTKRSSRKRKSRVYTPEERRQAVEAYYHSQLPQAEFARVWGVGHSSLCTWIKRYEEGGSQALERRIHAGKGKRRINEDGFDDICVGLGYADREEANNCGEIHVFLSKPPLVAVPRLVAGPGPGPYHPPLVVITDGEGQPLDRFLAYGVRRFGSNVACGDLDGDGREEIITGAGPGDVFGPHVRGWHWNGGSVAPIPGVSFLDYGTNRFGGNVSCGDIDGDLIAEIVTGTGPGKMFGSHVRGWNYDGQSLSAMQNVNFMAYHELSAGYGCVVACGDVDNDRVCEILTLPGTDPDYPASLKTWNYDGNQLELVERRSFLLFEEGLYGTGGHVTLGRLWEAPGYLDPPESH